MKRHGTKFLNALALLLILVTAHAGKVLHTHPDAYYRALEQTRSDQTRTTIVDDCPVCHFQFFSCLHTEPVLLVCHLPDASGVRPGSARDACGRRTHRPPLPAGPARFRTFPLTGPASPVAIRTHKRQIGSPRTRAAQPKFPET